jgi:hypothetical protein
VVVNGPPPDPSLTKEGNRGIFMLSGRHRELERLGRKNPIAPVEFGVMIVPAGVPEENTSIEEDSN